MGKVVIADDQVITVWRCPHDENPNRKDEYCEEEVHVDVTFFQDNGTPVCPGCGDDMVYDHVYLDIETHVVEAGVPSSESGDDSDSAAGGTTYYLAFCNEEGDWLGGPQITEVESSSKDSPMISLMAGSIMSFHGYTDYRVFGSYADADDFCFEQNDRLE